jgi:hypothetical protein
MRRITLAASAAALLLASLTACGSDESPGATDAAAPVPDATITPTVEPEPTQEATEEADDQPYGLTDTVTYENGVEVSLSKFSRKVSADYASPENTPYVKFTVKLKNGSTGMIDATSMQVNCQFGDEGQESESVFEEGLNGSPETRLLAGRSITVPWGCELPKKETFIQIEVAPDFESQTAIFTGNVK